MSSCSVQASNDREEPPLKSSVRKADYNIRAMQAIITEEVVALKNNNNATSLHDNFSELPVELITHIALFLHPSDLINFNLTNKFAHDIANMDIFKNRIKIHYGAYLINAEGSTQSLVLKCSKDSHNWSYQPLDQFSGINKFSLTKYNNKLYMALSQKEELMIVSSDNFKTWHTILNIPCTSLLDFELTPFRNSLYLAFIPSKTKSINMIFSKNGTDWEEIFEVGVSNVNLVSLTEFNNKLFLAYANVDNGKIYTTFSQNGKEWPQLNINSACHWGTHDSLKLISYQGKLRMAHIHGHKMAVGIGSSINGSNEWILDIHRPTPQHYKLKDLIMNFFKNELHTIYTFKEDPNSQYIIKSQNGVNWSNPNIIMATKIMDVSSDDLKKVRNTNKDASVVYSQVNLQAYIKYLVKAGHAKGIIANTLNVPISVITSIISNSKYKPRVYNLEDVWNAAQEQYYQEYEKWAATINKKIF